MPMYNVDFVTYEQALSLRKLGFNEDCLYHYDHNNPYDVIPNSDVNHAVITVNDFKISFNSMEFYNEICYDAPTLAQAQKWIIKEKLYYVQPYADISDVWLWDIINLRNSDLIQMVNIQGQPNHYNSYEEALSAGITECIKLLEKIG